MSAAGEITGTSQRRKGRPLVSSAAAATAMWESAWPLDGRQFHQPIVWLRAQSLEPEGVPGALERVRWHPHCPTGLWRVGGRENEVACRPALLLPLEVIGGPPGARTRAMAGVLAYYLSGDGRMLRRHAGADGTPRPAIKTFGHQKGAGFWLTDPDEGGPDVPLIVGLGVAPVWSFVQTLIANQQRVRAVAVPSIHELQGGALRLPDGALPLWNLEADAERPPLLLDAPGRVTVLVPPVQEAVPLRVRRAAEAASETVQLGQADRAHLCRTLAIAHWRRAGASDVRGVMTGWSDGPGTPFQGGFT